MNTRYLLPLFLLLAAFTATSCKMNTSEKETQAATTNAAAETEALLDENGNPILLGIKTRAALEAAPYDSWFEVAYKEHTLDTATINALKGDLAQTDITLFMGTWCEDSQRETPAFYKILDLAGIDVNKVKLITVSEEKDTPQGLEKGQDITNVPTIILSKKGEEIGRIVEYPIESLEKDLSKILSGQEYKHAYEE